MTLPRNYFATLFFPSGISWVLGHGIVTNIVIDGKKYVRNTPTTGDKLDSAIRLVDSEQPVTKINSSDMTCGMPRKGSQARAVATAQPGSQMQVYWMGGPDGKVPWPHVVGPIMTYLTACKGSTADKFDPSGAEWFKIDEQGLKPDSDANWFLGDVANGLPVNVALPDNIQSGDYLLRHEIIALHNGVILGGAEFYPSCIQLHVTGNGNGVPNPAQLATFPGASNDTGIHINPYPGSFNGTYPFPGPPLATIITSVPDAGPDNESSVFTSATATSSSQSTTPSTPPTPTPTSTASESVTPTTPTSQISIATGRCKSKQKKRSALSGPGPARFPSFLGGIS